MNSAPVQTTWNQGTVFLILSPWASLFLFIFWQWWATCTLSWLKLSVRPWTHGHKYAGLWVCVLLLAVSWVEGFLHSVMQLSTIYGLPFCGPKVTDHFMWNVNSYWNSYVLTPRLLASYTGQWRTDLHFCVSALIDRLWSHPELSEEPESRGRQKALHICLSHISVVVCFFVLVVLYMEDLVRPFLLKNNWVYLIQS